MKTALVFPGQGSQSVGMGKALADAFPAAREVFAEVDAALGENLSRLIFEGPEAELTLTANAQPALMATSLAALRALETEAGLDVGRDAAFVAGHSLGEYSALCAAGALSIADAARLLRIRGEAMQKAVPAGEGAMAAILGLDFAVVSDIALQAARDLYLTGAICEAANDNGGGQVVISGTKAAVERAMQLAKDKGAKRALALAVSAPFHSSLMHPAAEAMAAALANARLGAPKPPLVANVSASPLIDPRAIRESLVAQITGTVRWRESVAFMAAQGVTRFVEIGAGKVLAGLVKRIAEGATAISVGTPADVAAFRPAP
jgi:[acyl-carrier-protein] S-malonyltransferase